MSGTVRMWLRASLDSDADLHGQASLSGSGPLSERADHRKGRRRELHHLDNRCLAVPSGCLLVQTQGIYKL